jgi:hypothetical protein
MILLIQSSAGLLAQESLSITLEDDGQKFWSKLARISHQLIFS